MFLDKVRIMIQVLTALIKNTWTLINSLLQSNMIYEKETVQIK